MWDEIYMFLENAEGFLRRLLNIRMSQELGYRLLSYAISKIWVDD